MWKSVLSRIFHKLMINSEPYDSNLYGKGALLEIHPQIFAYIAAVMYFFLHRSTYAVHGTHSSLYSFAFVSVCVFFRFTFIFVSVIFIRWNVIFWSMICLFAPAIIFAAWKELKLVARLVLKHFAALRSFNQANFDARIGMHYKLPTILEIGEFRNPKTDENRLVGFFLLLAKSFRFLGLHLHCWCGTKGGVQQSQFISLSPEHFF